MIIQDGKVILGKRNCKWCSKGKIYGKSACPDCLSNPKKGCVTCKGTRLCVDRYILEDCPYCNGRYENFINETLYDSVKDALNDVEFLFSYHLNDVEYNRRYETMWAGIVAVYDEGNLFTSRKEEDIINWIRRSEINLFRIVDPDTMNFTKYIQVDVSRAGYIVYGVFD